MAVASLSHVKEVLDRQGTKAKKKFGQNFLIDANTVDKIAALACEKDYRTVEIGPGIGSLSEMLLKYSASLTAYEIDKDMYTILEETFGDRIELYLEDFLKVDLKKVNYRDEEINICSNLPYYVTTAILFKLFESELKIRKITVMVQKEVAQRFKAEVGSEDYNALSLIVQYLYDVKQEMAISRKVFYPMPNVDSAIVSFKPKRERNRAYEEKLFGLFKLAFTQRRKTLYNNLKESFDKEKLLTMFTDLEIKDNVRAQELSLTDFERIYKYLYEA